MRKNKSLKLVSILFLLSLVLLLASCGKKEDVAANPMQYMGVEDLKESIDSDSGDYIILDVRKKEDFDKEHIVGAYDADQDAAKGGDHESGISNLKTALEAATGSETGSEDSRYALVCYSGKSYAQQATDLMIEMGIPADKIYTVEGGMTAWGEAGDEYKNLLGD